MIAAGIISTCRLARSRDSELACIGALIVCALVAYLLQGYNDQGFFFYRIAFAVGSLLGLGEAAIRLNADNAGPAFRQAREARPIASGS